MYEGYWKLSRKPFSQRTTVEDLYLSQSQQAATRRLRYCIDNTSGLGVVTGGAGTGKSALLKALAAAVPDLRPFVHVIFPLLTTEELLRLIATELLPEPGLPSVDDMASDQLLRSIRQSIQLHCRRQRHPVICFDDAHQLSDQVLQGVVQPLLNLCDADDAIHCSLVLAGQPVLYSHLRKHGQISDRIGVTSTVQGFSEQESAEYVRTVLQNAGVRQAVFSDDALRRLFEISGGNPRRLNRLCDMALLVGCAENLTEITAGEIDAISHELMPAAA